jgi:hypothetical protein
MSTHDVNYKDMSLDELLRTYELYKECNSKGFSDYLRIAKIENELNNRGIKNDTSRSI